jgi:uncharacterized repeat protein (TIGR01451 family)
MKTWQKIITAVATFAVLFNSFAAPLTVLAQETPTPEPTSTPIESPAPTETSTPLPTETPTTTPEATVEPTVTPDPTSTPDASPTEIASPTPEVTPEATDLVTPIPSDQPTVEQAPESNPTVQGPPASTEPEVTPTVSPTFTPVEVPEDASITTTVVETSVIPVTVQENSWFKLITDKLDYAPDEMAIITGSNFDPNKTYSITVSSSDDPATSSTKDIVTDSNGGFTFYYQLDGNYRPNYSVEVKDGESVVATTTFTDHSSVSLSINSGNSTTTSRDVTLSISYNATPVPTTSWYLNVDTPTSCNSSLSWGSSEAYSNTKAWQLTSGYGDKKVCIKTSHVTGNSQYDDAEIKYVAPTTGTIKVIKDVVPNDSSLWDFAIAGPTNSSVNGLGDGGQSIAVTSNTGSYTITETTGTNSSNYTTTYSCLNATAPVISGSGMIASFTLSVNQNIVCTFTNTALAQPTLKLVKSVDQGPGQASDWTLNASGTTNGFSDAGNSTSFHTVSAGTAYTLSETPVGGNAQGYSQFGSWQCSAGSLVGSVLTLGAGQNVTCTITNNRDTGSLKVHKYTDLNGDGDWDETNEKSDSNANTLGFRWMLDGGAQQTFGNTVNGWATSTPYYNHTLDEYAPSGYHFVGWYVNGGNGSCTNPDGTSLGFVPTVTKNIPTEITLCNARDKMGSIKIVKSADPLTHETFHFHTSSNIGGSHDNFNLEGNDDSDDNSITYSGLSSGHYWVSEESKNGWHFDSVSCTGGGVVYEGSKAIISLTNQDVVCTYYNTESGSISGHKWNDLNGNGVWDQECHEGYWEGHDHNRHWHEGYCEYTEPALDDWRIFIDGNSNGTYDTGETHYHTDYDGDYEFSNLVPGNYSICEELQSGWSNTYPGTVCQNITVGAGENKNDVNFGNREIPQVGTVTVTKFNDLNRDENWDTGDGENEPTLNDWEIILDKTTQRTVAGQTVFSNLTPGNHFLSENIQTGWVQTNIYCDRNNQVFEVAALGVLQGPAGYVVNVPAGGNVNCYIGNFQVNSKVLLAKSNNRPSGVGQSDTVTYTLSLENTGNVNLENITIQDVPPGGFAYVAGSTIIDGVASSDPSISGSKLSWTIAGIAAKATVTIVYQLKTPGDLSEVKLISELKL